MCVRAQEQACVAGWLAGRGVGCGTGGWVNCLCEFVNVYCVHVPVFSLHMLRALLCVYSCIYHV